MSKPLSYNELTKSWGDWLKSSPVHYLRINKIVKGRKGSWLRNGRSSTFYAKDIFEKYDSVGKWLDKLILKEGLNEILVVFKKRDGRPAKGDLHLNFSERRKTLSSNGPAKTKSEEMTQATTKKEVNGHTQKNGVASEAMAPPPVPPQTQPKVYAPPPPPQYPMQYPPQQHNGLAGATMANMGGLGQAALAAGMGLPELIEVKKKADRADEYKEQLTKAKEENHALTLENRTLRTEKDTADKSRELAVLEATLGKQTFWDKIPMEKLAGMAEPIMQMMAAKNGGEIPQGLASPSNLSEAKQSFVELIGDPMFTDDIIKMAETVVYLMAVNPQFLAQLNQLTQQYGSNG